MHIWGDEFFQKHGNDLYDAITYCEITMTRYGRINTGLSKEKYGTFRDNAKLYNAWWPIHELVKPNYNFYSWPKWLMRLEIMFGEYVIRPLRLHKIILWWQAQVYNYTIQTVVKKYPQIADELLSDLGHYELVKPGLWGPLNGAELEKKYWSTL